MKNANTREAFAIISGEGTGPGTIEFTRTTDRGARMRRTRERCHGDRWCRVYYRINTNVWQELDGYDVRHINGCTV